MVRGVFVAEIMISWAHPAQWSDIMKMVWKTFLEFEGKVYPENGRRDFFNFITDDRVYKSFLRGNYQIMVAKEDEKIVGMASVRNGNFLSLLFVDADYHGRYVGSSLLQSMCEYLKKEVGYSFITVKSAPSAQGFYEKNGFYVTGEMEEYNGVTVIPMEKRL